MVCNNVRATVILDIKLAKQRKILENVDRIAPVHFLIHVRVGITRRVIVVIFLRDDYPGSERHHEGDSGA
jgi:hypothetical protein